MKQLILLICFMLMLMTPARAELEGFHAITFQNAVGGTGNGTALPVAEYTSVGVQVVISATATVTFEVTSDDSNWVSKACTDVTSTTGSAATSTSASGVFQCNVAGMSQFRARVSAWTSGTVTVTGRATTAIYARGVGSGGGGGSIGGSTGATDLAVIIANGTGGSTIQASTCTIATGLLTCPNGLKAGTSGIGTMTLLEGADPGAAANSGETVYYKNSTTHLLSGHPNGGSNETYITDASTSTLTGKSLDCEGTGNTCTIPVYWDIDLAGVSGGTALHVWNDDPLSTSCTPLAVTGTNRTTGYCTFADVDGDYGRQITRYLPTGWTGSFDAEIWWKTTGTGNARFQIATKCYADDDADDAAMNTASIVTAAAGTSGRPNRQTITGITTTGCAANKLMRIRFFRNRTEASDTLNAALDVEKVVFIARVGY